MAVMDSISEAAFIQFNDNFHERVQQKKSRLQPYCKMQVIKGKFATYDGIGTLELTPISGRFAPIEFSDLEFNRRKISKARFGLAVGIDKNDVENMLTDPHSPIIAQLAAAAQRQIDRIAYAAMFASVVTGEDLNTTVTAANDGVVTVDATAGLTYEKLLEIHENFIDNEVGNDGDIRVCMGITGNEHTDLMSELELTSGDYSREYVVDKGRIQSAAGIELVRFAGDGVGGANPILTESGGVRTSFAMAEGALVLGIARQWSIKVQDRNDMYDTDQIVISGVLGAVRTEGKLIQKVTSTVS